ncbi:cytochrome P450 9e2-like isoform X1 [Zerene cesonia]|uniref:cytochrome P450 9e2-like isoform X1 n=1 Tax=Zerene cesonia TaxID=33412 RepID=UPI0018E574B8|nr:cytochrome P450 9e2-like isoform X1 [Zerene cesonia]
MIFLIWTGVILTIVYIYLRQIYSRFTANGVKQIDPVPLLGNMWPIITRKHNFIYDLETYYKQFPNERFVGKFEFMNAAVVVRDLDLIKKITIKDFEHFLDHRGFTDEEVEPIFARNLFSLRGQEWKDMRSTMSPAFTSSKIRVMVPFIEEVGNQMIQALKKRIDESESGTIEVDCKDLTTRVTNDVIATCAFGLKVNSHEVNNEFYEKGKEASQFKLRQMFMFFAYNALPGLVKRLKLTLFSKSTTRFFTRLVLDTMSTRETNKIIRPDMIHLLMEAKKGQLNHEEKPKDAVNNAGFATVEESSVGKRKIQREWTDNDLIAQAVLFFIAGFETISTSMSFALHELALNPEIQERLVKEIKEDAAKHNGKIDYHSIQSLPYLDMVISEVLRMWPPAFQLDRVCAKDYNMGKPNSKSSKDFILRKGEIVLIPMWCIHRDPEFFPNPEKFDPERFSEKNKDKINPMTYMPFGVGPRNCIGSRFALLELKMILYQILLHVNVSPCSKTCIPTKLAIGNFNVGIAGGHWLNFELRQ